MEMAQPEGVNHDEYRYAADQCDIKCYELRECNPTRRIHQDADGNEQALDNFSEKYGNDGFKQRP